MRLEDDFYTYVNAEWLKNAVIPPDRPATGTFHELDESIEKYLLKLSETWLQKPESVNDNPHLSAYVKLLRLARDEKSRESNEIPALLGLSAELDKYTSFAEICRNYGKYKFTGLPFPLTIDIEADMKRARKKILYFGPAGTILPDSTYYQPGHPQAAQLLDNYKHCTSAYLQALGLSNVEELVELTMKFDASFAIYTKSNEQKADYVDSYHPQTLQTYIDKLPADLQALGTELQNIFHLSADDIVSDSEPEFTASLSKFVNSTDFFAFKAWALVNFLLHNSKYLTDDLRIKGGEYGRMLLGSAEPRNFERYTFDLANSYYSDPVGLYYAHTNFSEQSKMDVLEMLKQMIQVYEQRLSQNTWLSASTKEKAIKKLKALQLHIAYPDKISPLYDKLLPVIDENKPSLLLTCTQLNQTIYQYTIDNFAQEIDPELWSMPADMVNAYYSPSKNCIVFPAAILQKPYYDLESPKAANYGGIGAVMAHEISHAFDNNGCRFDENGNLEDWWQPEDYEAFKKKTQEMIALFDNYPTPAGKCNGKLTVSENIADAGGLACAYTAAIANDKEHEAEFYMSWARVWRSKFTPQFEKILLSLDPHAPCILRANRQLMNLSPFAEYYKLQPDDGMYLAKEKRVSIW